MKEIIKYWLIVLLTVYGVFVCQQIVFLLYNSYQLGNVGFLEMLMTFKKSISLNLSMLSYTIALLWLIFVFQLFVKQNFLIPFTKFYLPTIIVLFFVFSTGELELYREWGSKLNFKAISYLDNPSEVFKSSSNTFTLIFFGLLIVQSFLFIGALFKLLPSKINYNINLTIKHFVSVFLIFVFGLFLLVMGIRGGLQQVPINQSSCYFSKHQVLNLAATNSIWNLMHSILQNKKLKNTNIYEFIPRKEAEQMVANLHQYNKDSSQYFLDKEKPNVMFIIFEGWAGDAIGACNGDSTITPFFNSLANKGVNFENCYASGNRSDQGMAAIFSAFPSQSLTSIIEQPDKFSKLPCITTKFKEKGYYCSYYFGGQLSYANIESYMIFNQMDSIIDVKTVGDKYPKGKLGIHDEYMYELLGDDLKKMKQPFFTSFFTGSTHAPYDIPSPSKKKWGNEEDDYVNSLIYADKCLEKFFKQNQNEWWFKNTLFVFVADHAHFTHRHYGYFDKLNRQIPMLFYGDVIKKEYRGKNYKKVVSQTDLAGTVLEQLKMPHLEFIWSKDMMNNSYKEFAFYSFQRGGGWLTNKNGFSYCYNEDMNEWSDIKDSAVYPTDLKNMKAYMQVMFQQYLDY